MRDDAEVYLVWSSEYQGWWRPHGWGWSASLDDAAHLDRNEALRICRNATAKVVHVGRLAKIPVRLADVQDFLAGQV